MTYIPPSLKDWPFFSRAYSILYIHFTFNIIKLSSFSSSRITSKGKKILKKL